MTKREQQIVHAKKRAQERFGTDINKCFRRDLVDLVASGKLPIIRKQSNRVYVYEIDLNGQKAQLVYDKMRKVPITFLYMDDPDAIYPSS